MNDPNFPSNLNIRPLLLTPSTDSQDVWKQQDAIRQYGIAGRIWEASSALIEYFTSGSKTFQPQCSIFDRPSPTQATTSTTPHKPRLHNDGAISRPESKGEGKRIIELGSGQSVASLHLASQLSKDDLLVLTDLPNVVTLIQQSIDTYTDQSRNGSKDIKADHSIGQDGNEAGCQPVAEPMAWGADIAHLEKYEEWTHVICCDLVYFPHLYPPLLRTLLQLTDSTPRHDTLPPSDQEEVERDVFGPEVILAYKSRTLALEQSFFDSLALYFRLEPVVAASTYTEAKIYICRRWRVTNDWVVPDEKDVMNGSKQVIRGSSGFGLVEEMLGAIEWD